MTNVEHAQRLRRELDDALRSPVPSLLKIKLLVNDLVSQFEAHAAEIDNFRSWIPVLVDLQRDVAKLCKHASACGEAWPKVFPNA